MSNLLALDQASATSGYAIFNDGQLIDYGAFTFKDELPIRLVKIKEQVLKLIADYNIDQVAFEDIQLQGQNPYTFKVLAEVFGVITEVLAEHNMPFEIVHSQTWKSTLNIKGKKRADQKNAAKQFVLDTYGVKATQDACDAICIGTHILTNNIKNQGFDWSD